MKRLLSLSLCFSVSLIANSSSSIAAHEHNHAIPLQAKADLVNAEGVQVGHVMISELADGGVTLQIDAKGLTPGEHGIHFHQMPQCEGPKFLSAGDHFNPGQTQHGLKNSSGPHAGDLTNLNVPSSGEIKTHLLSHQVTLKPGPKSLLRPEGTSIVIHQDRDDQETNPSGNSGGRVLCGVIQKVTPAHHSMPGVASKAYQKK